MQGFQGTYECTGCCDDNPNPPPVVIHSYPFCRDCFGNGIFPEFEKALKDESQYPPKFGGQEIPFEMVQHLFDDASIQMWFRVTNVYKVPKKDRVYCAGQISEGVSCNKFLGQKSDPNFPQLVYCDVCKHQTCTGCGARAGETTSHICQETSKSGADDPLAGQVRGEDYMNCPGCGFIISLGSGCNHIRCPMHYCGTHFCFLCGKKAHPRDGKGHWNLGSSCSLYSKPRPGRGIFMPPDFHWEVPQELKNGPVGKMVDAHNNAFEAHLSMVIRLATDVGDMAMVRRFRSLHERHMEEMGSKAMLIIRSYWAQLDQIAARLKEIATAAHARYEWVVYWNLPWRQPLIDVLNNLPLGLMTLMKPQASRLVFLQQPGARFEQLKDHGIKFETKEYEAVYQIFPELRIMLRRYMAMEEGHFLDLDAEF